MKNKSALRVFTIAGVAAASVVGLQFVVNSWSHTEGESLVQFQSASAKGQKGAVALTCSDIRARVGDFVKHHYSVRSFNEEISKRTFSKYFQLLDPGKNFFTAEDIESFRSYEKTLPQAVSKVDCRFISNTHDLLLKRVVEANELVDAVLSKPFDFTLDEKIETDRKKIAWAKNKEDLKERWRKQFKLAAMGLKETESNDKEINQRLKKRFQMMRKSVEERTGDEINNFFMNAFALSLDPHSTYMLPEDQDEFRVAFSLQLVGIGASLSNSDGYTVVESVIAGGAAARDGRLKKGDKIINVDSGDGNGFVDVVDMELGKVVQLIRGKKDTLVKLMILRKDENGEVKRFVLELTRDIVHLQDGEARSDVKEVNGKKIGVINLPGFYIDYRGNKNSDDFRSASGDTLREIKKLNDQKVDGIVFDLRRNGGGDLGECVKLTGLFIDRGPVVQVAGRDGDVESLDDKNSGAAYTGPLLVLTSKMSASASEIFAGAIQDYGRGIIAGDSRTYGKGTVQNVIDIAGTLSRPDNGALKVTISKFYRPSGKSNQERGVPSDVVIPDLLEVADISESENDYVLPYSTIEPRRWFRPIQDLSGVIDQLKKKSAERVSESKEFVELKEKMEKAEKEQENTQLSLKIESKKGPKATPSPAPTAPPSDTERNVVISKEDIQLHEAMNILVDSIALVGKKDWTR